MPLTFPKAEKLCGKREIAALVTHGRRGGSGCLRYCYLVAPLAPISPVVPDSLVSPDPLTSPDSLESPGPMTSPAAEPLSDQVRILISVPKKLFKRAVKRNLLKRRIRESYRLQKELLPTGMDIAFIYVSREVLPFEEIYSSMTAALTAAAQQVTA